MSKSGAERLGYPTQKPVELLERIVATSSNIGDVVLDPFCGCGTAVHAHGCGGLTFKKAKREEKAPDQGRFKL